MAKNCWNLTFLTLSSTARHIGQYQATALALLVFDGTCTSDTQCGRNAQDAVAYWTRPSPPWEAVHGNMHNWH